MAGEITPVSAEQSATGDDNEATNGAHLAIDLDFDTRSWTVSDQDDNTWLRLTLDQVHCVTRVIWYWRDGTPGRSWGCSDTQCTCTGENCSYYTLTVSTTGTLPDNLPIVTDCKYGDTVQVDRVDGGGFIIREISVEGKQGG